LGRIEPLALNFKVTHPKDELLNRNGADEFLEAIRWIGGVEEVLKLGNLKHGGGLVFGDEVVALGDSAPDGLDAAIRPRVVPVGLPQGLVDPVAGALFRAERGIPTR
jgi:hypothetical protein